MNQQAPIRIVVTDSDSLFRLGVKALLAEDPSFEVVGEASEGHRTLELIQRLRPDVALLDLAIRGISALEILKRLQALELQTKTVVVAAELDRATTRTALLRGARGVLLKELAANLLTKCIRQVMKGELWIGRDDVEDLVETLRRRSQPTGSGALLTARELEIVTLVIEGASNKTIAQHLGIGEQTVKNRLRKVFAKVQVANRVELALHAVKYGLISKD